MKEALYYKKLNSGSIKCGLCPNSCTIRDGEYGICRVRRNDGGKLVALTYGMVSSIALDPIEKKPLDFFMPGTYILSVGTFGCNFRCGFCQNWTISQEKPELKFISPGDLVETATGIKRNIGIAFTYNEPSIWYEYVLETCKLNKENGLVNVLVTNGYINAEPLDELLPYIDAMNIDLKSFNSDYYLKVCGGKLGPVKDTIKKCAKACHVEITNLSVPGLNDSVEEMDEMCRWISSIDKNIPLHIIPFRPLYKMTGHPAQTFGRLSKLSEAARKHLARVAF